MAFEVNITYNGFINGYRISCYNDKNQVIHKCPFCGNNLAINYKGENYVEKNINDNISWYTDCCNEDIKVKELIANYNFR